MVVVVVVCVCVCVDNCVVVVWCYGNNFGQAPASVAAQSAEQT